jgi:hypothetical protein
VITAAAAIMVTVFGALVLDDGVFLKLAGLGLATAVFVDATVVRMVLVPATMEVLGDHNWWLPNWLDRLLHQVAVDGAAATPEQRRHEVMAGTSNCAQGHSVSSTVTSLGRQVSSVVTREQRS